MRVARSGIRVGIRFSFGGFFRWGMGSCPDRIFPNRCPHGLVPCQHCYDVLLAEMLLLSSAVYTLCQAAVFIALHTAGRFVPAVPLKFCRSQQFCSQLVWRTFSRVVSLGVQEGFVAEDDLGARDDYTREVDEEAAFKQAQVSLSMTHVNCMAPR